MGKIAANNIYQSAIKKFLGSYSCLELLHEYLDHIRGDSNEEGRLIYMANSVDLWKYLCKKIMGEKSLEGNFTKIDLIVIQRSINLARSILYDKLYNQITQHYSICCLENPEDNQRGGQKTNFLKKIEEIKKQISKIRLDRKLDEKLLSENAIFTEVICPLSDSW